ncbi:MAG: helicase HerA-like domain-containing protein [Candidatus Woesearchaeota archaeon]
MRKEFIINKKTPSLIKILALIILFFILFNSKNSFALIIEPQEINEFVAINKFLELNLTITNDEYQTLTITLEKSKELEGIVDVKEKSFKINPKSSKVVELLILGNAEQEIYFNKSFKQISGYINILPNNKKIPVRIVITDGRKSLLQTMFVELEPVNKVVAQGSTFKYKISINNLLTDWNYNVTLFYKLVNEKENMSIDLGNETILLKTSKSLIKSFEVPENFNSGDYKIIVDTYYLKYNSTYSTLFTVQTPFLKIKLFGKIMVWQLLLLFAIAGLLAFAYVRYRVFRRSRLRYGVSVDVRSLRRVSDKLGFVGRVAEVGVPFYFDLNLLTTHCIVAGATGGGKSVAAQVLVEECLKRGVGVLVFDPTAQWSGFLRPCSDVRMLGLYSSFGLKRSDARGFPGNVRLVRDAREVVDVRRFLRAGEVNVFVLSRLEPEDIDFFVANTVREVFRAGFDEFGGLRFLLVYDEVHRLLPRFGGSGEGFVQIERACREFRKWGIGVVLISQVLSDFVGEIKANINTEIQVRTRDEGDLQRVREKYGEEFLRGLVRASVGTGLFENPVYNGGRPFFVSFRPLLHSVSRLSDEDLDAYDRFNGLVDQLGFELDSLEGLGVDVFDLRLELRLAVDKLKVGNFGMVEVYLDGLRSRVDSVWRGLGRVAPVFERRLVSREEVLRSVEEAKRERQKAIKQEKKERGEDEEEEESEEEDEEENNNEKLEKENEEKKEKEIKNERESDAEEIREEKTTKKTEQIENKDQNNDEKILEKIDLLKKETEPQFYFTLKNDKKLKSIYDLIEELEVMSDDVFYFHVNDYKNDFENWIRFVFLNNELADKISKMKTKRDMLKAIGEYIGRGN